MEGITGGVICDRRVPPHVKVNIHETIVQPVMPYGMETVQMTSSHVKKSDRNEEVQMDMRPYTKRPCEKR